MTSAVTDNKSNSIRDVEQLGVWAGLVSLSYVFWICGGMEMIERFAYYGVRNNAALYATAPVSEGGLGITATQLGNIFFVWALVQTWVPVITGGLSDRFGYKETIFAATLFKIAGYVAMAMFVSYWGFMTGAILVAFGTAIFKPGLQGTIVKSTDRRNSSIAWGVFYQTVNIGGYFGTLIAIQMRQLSWDTMFYVNAGMIMLNLILLLVYKEPEKEERLARRAKIKSGEIVEPSLWKEAIKEFKRPILIYYVLLFSGFWFMVYSFFDVLPLHIRDWIDTSTIVTTLFGPDGTQNSVAHFMMGLTDDGRAINPAGLFNLNAFLIMLTCFFVAGLSARMKAANSMAVGTFLISAGLIMVGGLSPAWLLVSAIAVFSVGEMLASPKSSEYLGNIAPADKKAMYLGFSQAPIGIGWTLEGKLGPSWYDQWASKETFSRQYLAENGVDQSSIDAIPNGEAFTYLVDFSGQSAAQLTDMLYQANNIGQLWYVMASIGVVSAFGLYVYGRWTYRVATA